MNLLFFFKEYIANPKGIGAIVPSSRFLAEQMLKSIDFRLARCIVEYGAGSGVFTDKLVEKRKKETTIMVIENNYKFYKILKVKYQFVDNLYVFYGSAENIDVYMRKIGINNADFIVSGLPFSSMPKEVSNKILFKSCCILEDEGKFIAFQYSSYKKAIIGQFFDNVKTKFELRNIPPALVYTCSKTKHTKHEKVNCK